MIIKPEMETGKVFYTLGKAISYMEKGKDSIASVLVLREPVKNSSIECIKLSAMIQKSSGESMRAFFGDDIMNKKDKEENVVGEEIVPFHLRKKDDPEEVIKKVIEEVKGISQIVLMSENIDRILKAGKTLLTRVWSSNEGAVRLLTVDDENRTGITEALFNDMEIEDQIFVVCLYYCFFGLSSIGQRKTTSSKVQD